MPEHRVEGKGRDFIHLSSELVAEGAQSGGRFDRSLIEDRRIVREALARPTGAERLATDDRLAVALDVLPISASCLSLGGQRRQWIDGTRQ